MGTGIICTIGIIAVILTQPDGSEGSDIKWTGYVNSQDGEDKARMEQVQNPLTDQTKRKPVFDKKVAMKNFTCPKLTGTGASLGSFPAGWCQENVSFSVPVPVARADIWLWCGEDELYDRLPVNASGICALVSLMLPVAVVPVDFTKTDLELPDHLKDTLTRGKREQHPWLDTPDPTYIDAIGIPRGVPDEYKLADQVAAGWESILLWITPNKNVDRINYIHYNVQRLGNHTQEGFQAVHEQLKATSMMTFQNRIALDMLLAEKGGVCFMYGDSCCTFIPDNTAPGGRLTKALEGLATLNKKMKDNSGVETTMWDSWMSHFGKYKALVSSLLISIAVFAAMLTLCGCWCIPCLRGLIQRIIERAIGPLKAVQGQYLLLPQVEKESGDDIPLA